MLPELWVFLRITQQSVKQLVTHQLGDTILVQSGLYNENIKIDKSLTLQGQGQTNTVIEGIGGSTPTSVLTLAADDREESQGSRLKAKATQTHPATLMASGLKETTAQSPTTHSRTPTLASGAQIPHQQSSQKTP